MAGPGTNYFKPGNKLGGRTKGSRNKHVVMFEKIGTEHSESIVLKTIEMALMGDTACIKMILDRIWPVPKTQTFVETPRLDKIHTQTDINTAMTSILEDVGNAELSIEEGEAIQKMVESKGASIQKCNAEELDIIREQLDVLHRNK